MPVNYLNFYLISVIGSIVAIVAGIGFCYTGMSEMGFNVYRGMEVTTYYVDKNRYDLYLNGIVYCITFGAAMLLLLAVIVIPSTEQIQRRSSASPFGTPAVGTPPTGMEAPQMEAESTEFLEPVMTPEIEDYSNDEGLGMEGLTGEDDSDVVDGTGRITEEAHVDFLRKHSDRAVKFLMRMDLDDKPLKADDEKVHEEWQKRGLSRGKLRKQLLKLMDWESVPEQPVSEILSQLKDKVTT